MTERTPNSDMTPTEVVRLEDDLTLLRDLDLTLERG